MLFLPHKDNGSTLSLANSVWVDAQHTLPSQYVSGINSNFNAEVFSFDFNRPDMTSLVNNWCAQKTSNRISNVIKQFEPQSMFNIFSAMYFDGTWKTKFDKALTSDATFHGTLGDNTVKMMSVKDNFKAYRSNSFEAVVLPFKGEKTDMILVLPNEDTDFDSFASQFNANRFNDMTQHCDSYELTVKLPRFDIEQDFDITSAYEHYGLNLRGVNLQKAAVGTLNLYAQHFTSISVDEDGAKIAAVEKISGYTSVADGVLTFDRPFLMFVRNNVSGTILMAARIGNL
jgi:serpin B